MKTVLISLVFELLAELIRQIVAAGEIGEFLDELEDRIKKSETRADDAFLPILRAVRVVLGKEKETISSAIIKQVEGRIKE